MITDKVGGSSAKPEVSKQSKEKRLQHKVSGYKSQSKRRSIAGCRLLLRTLIIVMSETHVAHTKPLSRKHSLSESFGGSKVTKLIFSNSVKQSAIRWDDICCLNCV